MVRDQERTQPLRKDRWPRTRLSSRVARRRPSDGFRRRFAGGSPPPLYSSGKILGAAGLDAMFGSFPGRRMHGACGWGTTAASMRSKGRRLSSPDSGTGRTFTDPETASAISRLLDRRPHEVPPLRPGAVVVPDVRVAEEVLQDEPRVGRPLADPAVGDDLLFVCSRRSRSCPFAYRTFIR